MKVYLLGLKVDMLARLNTPDKSESKGSGLYLSIDSTAGSFHQGFSIEIDENGFDAKGFIDWEIPDIKIPSFKVSDALGIPSFWPFDDEIPGFTIPTKSDVKLSFELDAARGDGEIELNIKIKEGSQIDFDGLFGIKTHIKIPSFDLTVDINWKDWTDLGLKMVEKIEKEFIDLIDDYLEKLKDHFLGLLDKGVEELRKALKDGERAFENAASSAMGTIANAVGGHNVKFTFHPYPDSHYLGIDNVETVSMQKALKSIAGLSEAVKDLPIDVQKIVAKTVSKTPNYKRRGNPWNNNILNMGTFFSHKPEETYLFYDLKYKNKPLDFIKDYKENNGLIFGREFYIEIIDPSKSPKDYLRLTFEGYGDDKIVKAAEPNGYKVTNHSKSQYYNYDDHMHQVWRINPSDVSDDRHNFCCAAKTKYCLNRGNDSGNSFPAHLWTNGGNAGHNLVFYLTPVGGVGSDFESSNGEFYLHWNTENNYMHVDSNNNITFPDNKLNKSRAKVRLVYDFQFLIYGYTTES